MNLIMDIDDQGINHVISDMCEAHDCRDKLDQLHYLNPKFKVTLFAIPYYMTPEMLDWFQTNRGWAELAVHGFTHGSNYECEKITYEEFDNWMDRFEDMFDEYFVKGFKCPGWQTSDAVFEWLDDHDWWISCQNYDEQRIPKGLQAYVNNNGRFYIRQKDGSNTDIDSEFCHLHSWDVGAKGNEPNGIYESYDKVESLVREAEEFKFVSELFLV